MEKPQKKGAKGNVVQLDLVRMERNRKKNCTCKNPTYVVDSVNDEVRCDGCDAKLTAMAALKDVASRFDDMNAAQQAMEKRYDELMVNWEALERTEKFMKPLRRFLDWMKGSGRHD